MYQIGDDQARSWIETGSPAGTSTPSAAASRVLQRDGGISITRGRWALLLVTLANLWSAAHYLLGARTLRAELARAA